MNPAFLHDVAPFPTGVAAGRPRRAGVPRLHRYGVGRDVCLAAAPGRCCSLPSPAILAAVTLAALVALAGCALVPRLSAQSSPAPAPGSVDPSFRVGAGFDDAVNALAVQPDGAIVVGGAFRSYDQAARRYLVRLYANGNLDPGFGAPGGFDGVVRGLLLQPDGRIVAVGDFTRYAGVSRNRIARLNADGTLDSSFDPGTGFDATAAAVVREPGGSLVVGGAFSRCDRVARNRLARLFPDGRLDLAFDPGDGFDGYGVLALLRQPNGRFVAGGSFNQYQGTVTGSIARINADGSLDGSFNAGQPGFANVPLTSAPAGPPYPTVVTALALQSNRQILVGGSFASYDGTSRLNLARLQVDGSLDASFQPQSFQTAGFDTVTSLTVVSDNQILAGGVTSGDPVLVQLNVLGVTDPRFAPGPAGGTLNAVALTPEGQVVVGGLFGPIGNVSPNNLARLVGDGPVLAAAPPTVTIRATVPTAYRLGAVPGVLRVRRAARDDLGAAVTVGYMVAGTAVGGTDYQTLSGQVAIPVGQRSARVLVQPLPGTGRKAAVDVTLTPAPANAYLVGPQAAARVRIRSGPPPG